MNRYMQGRERLSAPDTHREPTEDVRVRILLADDEKPVRELTARILVVQGWEVVAVNNGRAAVDAWPAEGNPFDLVILDVMMPEMNGREAYKELVRLHPEARFLVVSGDAGSVEWPELHEGGQLLFLAKPFRAVELVTTVRALLGQEYEGKTLAVGGQAL